MQKIIQALFLIGTSLIGYSQVTISGTISDTEKNSLFGVEIYAKDLHIGTTSDIDGIYTLKNVPHGHIELIFSFIGYEPVIKELDIHKDIVDLNIQLKEGVFHMEEVIISTPFNRLQSQNVMKVEVETAESMRKKGAPTLIDGLTNVAGVSQISTGTSIGKPVIRGLSGNRVLVYTQGVRLENQQFGDEHGLGLNQSGIESVEVIKGPASLLYGSDALGGVIYFNPEKFAPKNSFVSSVNQQYFSNTSGSSTSFGIKKSLNQWKYIIRGSHDNHLDYKIPTGEMVTNTRYYETNLNTAIGFNNENISSELRYNYNNSNVGLTEGIGHQENSRVLELPYQKINNHIVSLHNHIFFDNSKLDVNIGYIFNDRREFEDEHGHEDHDDDDDHDDHDDDDDDDHDEEDEHHDEAALQMELSTFNYDIKYHFPKSKSVAIIAGVQGMIQTNRNFGEELLIPNAQINDFGVFSTGIIDLDNSSIMAGLRYDNRSLQTEYHAVEHEHETHEFPALDKTYNSFTASLGYKFDLFNDITTRINLASGFRAPNLAELTSNGVHHGTNRFEIGNPNLETEQNFQTDVSFEYENKHFEFFVNGFFNSLNNYIYLNPTGEVEDGADVFEYTQENAKLYGGEVGIHLHPHPVDWLHLESAFEMVIGEQNNGDYLPLIPANNWTNTFRSEFDIKDWMKNAFASISVATTFEQNNVSGFETNSAGYSLVNFGIGGSLNIKSVKFDLTANLNNAFDESYISHLSRLKGDGIPNIGRNFIIGVNFNL